MEKFNAPTYIVSVIEKELERQKVDKDFVRSVNVSRLRAFCAGRCEPISTEDQKVITRKGKVIGVDIKLSENDEMNLSTALHESRHAKQYFTSSFADVENNPVYTEIDACLYEYRRVAEEKIKSAIGKFKSYLKI